VPIPVTSATGTGTKAFRCRGDLPGGQHFRPGVGIYRNIAGWISSDTSEMLSTGIPASTSFVFSACVNAFASEIQLCFEKGDHGDIGDAASPMSPYLLFET
jgi:hypothetical protein